MRDHSGDSGASTAMRRPWLDIADILKVLGVLVVLVSMFAALPAQAGDINNGRQLYELHCELCHGADGRGVTPDAPNFLRGEGLLKPDDLILRSLRNGVNAMPGYRGVLSDREMFDVISYLRTFF